MPPQRLGDSTWRDRTGRRAAHRRGRAERILGPIAAALVATVVLAVAAVWLTAPRQDRGVASGPSATASVCARGGLRDRPRAAAPSATPLPPLLRNGDLPSVTSVLVRSDGAAPRRRPVDRDARSVRLSVPTRVATTVVARPGGGWLCICVDWTAMRSDGPAGLRAVLQPVDADGTAGQAREIRTLTGVPDPAQALGSGSPLVDAGTSVSDDGRFAFVGWSVRDGEDWKAGLDVVDIGSGEVVTTVPVPLANPDVKTDRPIIRVAPAATPVAGRQHDPRVELLVRRRSHDRRTARGHRSLDLDLRWSQGRPAGRRRVHISRLVRRVRAGPCRRRPLLRPVLRRVRADPLQADRTGRNGRGRPGRAGEQLAAPTVAI